MEDEETKLLEGGELAELRAELAGLRDDQAKQRARDQTSETAGQLTNVLAGILAVVLFGAAALWCAAAFLR